MFQAGGALVDRDVMEGTERPEIAIGEVVDAAGFGPRPQGRDGRGTGARPDHEDAVDVAHEKSLVPCGSRAEASFSFSTRPSEDPVNPRERRGRRRRFIQPS